VNDASRAQPRTFLIDTDTASDDAVALVMALRSPDVRVAAITVVSGNVPLRQGVINALYTCELCGRDDVPVYPGADRPLRRAPAHAQWFHGADGMGEMNYPAPSRAPESTHAVDAMIETIRASPGIELVTLGPLTNVALALQRDRDLVKNVARCAVMGGNPCCEGNVTPAAEYNIWCDPEAAQLVLRTGLPVELVGWQLSRGRAVLNHDDIVRIRALDTKLGHFAIDCNRVALKAYQMQTGEEGIALPDPIAMAVALDRSVCTRAESHRIEVETASELTRGMTVVDKLGVVKDDAHHTAWDHDAERCSICWEIDVDRWKQMLVAALR
jgi:purine nucleosidase